MSDEQNSRVEAKLDLMLSNIQQMQIDIATMKANYDNRLTSLENFQGNFTKVLVGVLVAIIGGLFLVIMRGGMKL